MSLSLCALSQNDRIARLTVGVPVCNGMPWLKESIASLFEQTIKHFEILAIVDGGNDDSLAYLRTINDSRLRVLEQSNCGLTFTLNRMLRECRTPWLVRQDADDISHPERLEKIQNAIHCHPDAGMFYSLANYHPRGRAIGFFRSSRGSPGDLRRIVRSGYLLSICHSTVALNVRKTLAAGGYRLGLHNEDADLWWRMALRYDIHCIPEALVGFRQSPQTVSARNLAEQLTCGFYVQYLLLSYLLNREPRPVEVVREHLQAFLPREELQAKERLRLFNISMAARGYNSAAHALWDSLKASPAYVIRRARDEFFCRGHVRNGVDPALFLEKKDVLWP